MANSNNNFWAGKNVFITGHTGFKGSWLSLWLQWLGANVSGYALSPLHEKNLFKIARVSGEMQSTIGDIRDESHLLKALKICKPDIVFHLAAQPLVRRSYIDPIETYGTNVMGTVNLFEAIRKVDTVKAIVNVTTDKCYKNREWVWSYRENDILGGHDPYSSSKACAELVTDAFRDSFFKESSIATGTARAGNVIGGGDWSDDRLIPDIIKCIENNKVIRIRNPKSIRPWQHVIEPLSGYLILAEKLFSDAEKYSGAWNFGPRDEDSKSVEWIVDSLVNYWGSEILWELDGFSHPHEANLLKLDISKSARELDWKPKWSLSKALQLIVEWNRSLYDGEDMQSICLGQIKEHIAS